MLQRVEFWKSEKQLPPPRICHSPLQDNDLLSFPFWPIKNNVELNARKLDLHVAYISL